MRKYLAEHPFERHGKRIPRVHAIHEELRWIKIANGSLNLLGESNLPEADPQFIREVRDYYQPAGKFVNPDDYRIFFHLTGRKSKRFISHYLFLILTVRWEKIRSSVSITYITATSPPI